MLFPRDKVLITCLLLVATCASRAAAQAENPPASPPPAVPPPYQPVLPIFWPSAANITWPWFVPAPRYSQVMNIFPERGFFLPVPQNNADKQ